MRMRIVKLFDAQIGSRDRFAAGRTDHQDVVSTGGQGRQRPVAARHGIDQQQLAAVRLRHRLQAVALV